MAPRHVTPRKVPHLRVFSLSAHNSAGVVRIGTLVFRCALGRGGLVASKQEGDGATPIGRWPLRNVYFRGDRVKRPLTGLPLRRIARADGWCDAPGDRNYNRLVRHPYPASAEEMWRGDGLYDVVVELGYNHRPRVRGRGSAIFMHVAGPGYTPTAGCIALARPHFVRLLAVLRRGSTITIGR